MVFLVCMYAQSVTSPRFSMSLIYMKLKTLITRLATSIQEHDTTQNSQQTPPRLLMTALHNSFHVWFGEGEQNYKPKLASALQAKKL